MAANQLLIGNSGGTAWTQVATTSVSGALPISTGALHLGGDAVSAQWFAGLIDNVRVYARVLSPDELQTDMNTPL